MLKTTSAVLTDGDVDDQQRPEEPGEPQVEELSLLPNGDAWQDPVV